MLQRSIPRSARSNRLITGANGLSVSRNGYVSFLEKIKHFGWTCKWGIPKTSTARKLLWNLGVSAFIGRPFLQFGQRLEGSHPNSVRRQICHRAHERNAPRFASRSSKAPSCTSITPEGPIDDPRKVFVIR